MWSAVFLLLKLRNPQERIVYTHTYSTRLIWYFGKVPAECTSTRRARIQRLGRNWASGRGCATKIFEDQQLGMPTYMYFQTTAVLDLNSTNTGRSKYLLNLVPVLN